MLFFDAVNQFARDTPWAHGAVLAYAIFGVVLFGALLLLGWVLSRSRGPAAVATALWAGLATVLALGLNQPLVHAFHHARPYTDHPGILVLAHRSADGSFPSDHAVMAGAAAAGLWLVSRRLGARWIGAVAAALALAMAFARVYIAAHYPQDVLAGLVFGAAVALLGWALLGRLLTHVVERIGRTVLRPLVAA